MTSKTRKKQMPITRHRLFPAITALWSAALFGFGTFVVPVGLLSRLVELTGIATLLPAAAPPLGFTARALIALGLTGAGAVAGLIAGRALGRKQPRQPGRDIAPPPAAAKTRARDSHPDAPARRPFFPSEDIVEPGLPESSQDAPPVQVGRRRALAITDESAPLDVHEIAPLPGHPAVAALDLNDLLSAFEKHNQQPPFPAVEQTTHAAETQPDTTSSGAVPVAAAEDRASGAGISAPTGEAAAPVPRAVRRPGPSSPVMDQDLAELGVLQLVERLALAMARYNERHPGGPLPGIVADALSGVRDQVAPVMSDLESADPVSVEPVEIDLAEIGPVEAEPASPTDDAELREEPVQPAAPPRLAKAVPAAFTAPWLAEDEDESDLEMPGQTARFLTPGDTDRQEREAALVGGVELPSIPPAAPAAFAEEAAIAADDTGTDDTDAAYADLSTEDGDIVGDAEDEILIADEEDEARSHTYSSLVDLRSSRPAPFAEPALDAAGEPQRQVFIRVEEPHAAGEPEPVVLFPGQAAREPGASRSPLAGGESPLQSLLTAEPLLDRDEADRALRTALATLQRMGGSR